MKGLAAKMGSQFKHCLLADILFGVYEPDSREEVL
jgi:hypothetical protein